MENKVFYVVDGESFSDELVIQCIPSEVESTRLVVQLGNILQGEDIIGMFEDEYVFPIDDYIWFASEKAFKEFEKDIKELGDDVDFAEQDDFKNNVTTVSIWVESQDEPIVKQYIA